MNLEKLICAICNQPQQKSKMVIIEGPCWKCENSMKVAVLYDGIKRGASVVGPEVFTENELDLAKREGVLLKKHYSKTINKKYLANTCENCNSFIGQHYLFTQFASPAEFDELPSKTIYIGYHCDNCYEKPSK